ncbi:hypothetical protein [Chitinibacter tainanensis]|nr:hypothetical protein [Chitinibacter tainanensis]
MTALLLLLGLAAALLAVVALLEIRLLKQRVTELERRPVPAYRPSGFTD